MKVVQLTQIGRPLEAREIPVPEPAGHEVLVRVERVGPRVLRRRVGDRVCLHYLLTCGRCYFCRTGHEQFCSEGRMIGKHCDGGYAQYVVVPEINAAMDDLDQFKGQVRTVIVPTTC